MALVFLGLGSNIGDGRLQLQEAWRRITVLSGVLPLVLSRPYRTEPVGIQLKNWFTNAVGVLETGIAPQQLLDDCLAIERQMGRDRTKGEDRTIDIDILFYDDVILEEGNLTLPHPEIEKRLFVLRPLAEVAPDHRHPLLDRTIQELSRDLTRRCVHQSIQVEEWES